MIWFNLGLIYIWLNMPQLDQFRSSDQIGFQLGMSCVQLSSCNDFKALD